LTYINENKEKKQEKRSVSNLFNTSNFYSQMQEKIYGESIES
jgi:hypothetical protein